MRWTDEIDDMRGAPGIYDYDKDGDIDLLDAGTILMEHGEATGSDELKEQGQRFFISRGA